MAKRYTGKVIEIEATHRPYVGVVRGRNQKMYAQMSLWAITDTGHRVWIERTPCSDTRGIEVKLNEYVEQNEFMIGREISYVLKPSRDGIEDIGFIRK